MLTWKDVSVGLVSVWDVVGVGYWRRRRRVRTRARMMEDVDVEKDGDDEEGLWLVRRRDCLAGGVAVV
jgi:hypothetical protein